MHRIITLLRVGSFLWSRMAAGWEPSPQQRVRASSGENGRVYKDRITPHWLGTNGQFWYRNDLPGGEKEFILVDARRGHRSRAFDHERLAKALAIAAGKQFEGSKLPFEEIGFSFDGKEVRFAAAEKRWNCDLNSYECTEEKESGLGETQREPTSGTNAASGAGQGNRRGSRTTEESSEDRPGEQNQRRRSPDGKWNAFIKEYNVWIRSEAGEEFQLSEDGERNNAYGRLDWSPDSKALVGWRIVPGDRKEVYLVQSSPPGGGRAKLQTRPYALPGDRFTTYELSIFEPAARKQTRPKVDKFEHEWLRPQLHWKADGRHFAYEMADRGHQRFRVIEIDAGNGTVRNLIDERARTFIWTAHTEALTLARVNWIENQDEIIYVSESNGWRHLYLIDARAGALKNPITQGEWVVRGIETIDPTNRQVWFRASGVFPGQDPYLIHSGRVGFDGRDLVWLTEGNGNHSVQYSPDREFLIDTYSRVDLPPVHELRRSSSGQLICKLEEADIREIRKHGWEAPEVFVAKGRDGATDIWGIIARPQHFDPAKKYPVIEDIYAGPQGSFVPKTFSGSRRYAAQTDPGFIVVKIDGMGTANRSKAFHDVCWHNLKDAGFEDRILWMKAAAAKYPYMDLSRVGVYGTSAGAQSAAGAVLFHPEFYKVAVAACGCHDNRMDKASWNEQWMGYVPPEKLWSKAADNWYSDSSNIDNAYRLRGKLMLIVGEMDDNVPPESTYRFVDALIKAGKDFEFVMVPGMGHGSGGNYGTRRRDDFFAHNLLGVEPPDRNAEAIGPASSR